MALEKSHFSGSRLNYRTPCTSSEGRLCNIFEQLPQWNEFFWPVGFELRELSPGQLSLVGVHRWLYRLVEKQVKDAATLLHHLLTHHRCVDSLDLDANIFKDHERICDALRRTHGLRKLKLRLSICERNAAHVFAPVFPHLNQLHDLELNGAPFDRTSMEDLSEFLASTRSLRTLNITDLHTENDKLVVVIQGLKRNATIKTLSINSGILKVGWPCYGAVFSEYLKCNQTLRTLNVTSDYPTESSNPRPIIGALFHNNALTELNLIRFKLDIQDNELITGMLIQNRTLRSFHIIDYSWYDSALLRNRKHSRVRQLDDFGNDSSLISPWLMALAENSTLNELTLDLWWMYLDDCVSFFKALATNTSLKRVNVRSFKHTDVTQIFQAMRDTGVQERFVVGTHYIWQDTVAELLQCKQLSSISVSGHIFDDLERLQTFVYLLPTCSHVKSLRLGVSEETFNGKVSSLIAQYITNTTSLRELHLNFFFKNMDALSCCERTLFQALSLNKSIRRLTMQSLRINETQMFVDMLQSSRQLCYLPFIYGNRKSVTSLVQKLSSNVSSNYTLLGMHVAWYEEICVELFTINDVLRRNNSLVTRAAHFVMGTKHKYCAAAAELMQFNPGLVEKVQELSSVDETEAASRIKSSLKSFSELDDFMCLAGVVECSVTCHSRDDGQKQLVDLNRDCWLHLRQFLKVGDILDPK
ncbi:hypothetical protein HPB52_006711 [Rhipicephalus sanguineus]|uniref:Nlr family card domain protein n=1 Tax=Rhipicephalus sanguineus TaxID=34632 RepID=A0A9D4PJ84_RHISA|nr:hypothetical protein HPB52_006711 [Rhipicephalus sanguineus]